MRGHGRCAPALSALGQDLPRKRTGSRRRTEPSKRAASDNTSGHALPGYSKVTGKGPNPGRRAARRVPTRGYPDSRRPGPRPGCELAAPLFRVRLYYRPMQESDVLAMFRRSGALLDGHFRLSSGLHSPGYLQCALVLQHPRDADAIGAALADQVARPWARPVCCRRALAAS